jgi:hypothetical protein
MFCCMMTSTERRYQIETPPEMQIEGRRIGTP